jgi:glycosyltransferase involved in cell wall biosynthesis
MRELADGLAETDWVVDVLTTSLTSSRGPRSRRTRIEKRGRSTIVYAATPASYRWMGVTPTAPLWLERLPRPNIAHVFGLRDPIGTIVATWCRLRGIPYVLEGLGMFRPKLHKVGLKHLLDATVLRHVVSGASLFVAVSARERAEYVDAGICPARIVVRPNGFPPVSERPTGDGRARFGLPADEPLLLSVGRLAAGKGLELLVDVLVELPDVHLALAGPDDGHGTPDELRRRAQAAGVAARFHVLGPLPRPEIDRLYGTADVLALASRHESFGMVAAEAASAGLPVVVTDRCGVAELLRGAALVVPYERGAVVRAVHRILNEPELSARLAREGQAIARRCAWPAIVAEQAQIYRRVLGPLEASPALPS